MQSQSYQTEQECGNGSNGRTVLLLANKEDAPKTVSVELAGRVWTFELPAGSVNTIVL